MKYDMTCWFCNNKSWLEKSVHLSHNLCVFHTSFDTEYQSVLSLWFSYIQQLFYLIYYFKWVLEENLIFTILHQWRFHPLLVQHTHANGSPAAHRLWLSILVARYCQIRPECLRKLPRLPHSVVRWFLSFPIPQNGFWLPKNRWVSRKPIFKWL